MVRKMSVTVLINCCILFWGMSVKGEAVSDYLIINDIGSYKFVTEMKDFITGQVKPKSGYTLRNGPGDLIATGHFYLDHIDKTYETDYINSASEMAVEVQVVQHSGLDSDLWLLHEVEDSYRDGNIETIGFLTGHTIIRMINGNRIFYLGFGGGSFSWMNNNVTINISYTDLQGTKPEPLEVVQAYLQKFPSTIPTSFVLDKAHGETWIKEEMSRRLWLCDKWIAYQESGGTDVPKAVRELVGHLNEFLDYREKYFNISADSEKRTLDEYLIANNKTEIINKLQSYKQWWVANKNNPIVLS